MEHITMTPFHISNWIRKLHVKQGAGFIWPANAAGMQVVLDSIYLVLNPYLCGSEKDRSFISCCEHTLYLMSVWFVWICFMSHHWAYFQHITRSHNNCGYAMNSLDIWSNTWPCIHSFPTIPCVIKLILSSAAHWNSEYLRNLCNNSIDHKFVFHTL